jgi:hypothetical protein
MRSYKVLQAISVFRIIEIVHAGLHQDDAIENERDEQADEGASVLGLEDRLVKPQVR